MRVVTPKHFTVLVTGLITATYFCPYMVVWGQFVGSHDVEAAKETTYKTKMKNKKISSLLNAMESCVSKTKATIFC
jgi:hypothetical protein